MSMTLSGRPDAHVDLAALTTLADLPRGCSARIVEVCVDGDTAAARRMYALGFTPDAAVTTVRRAPLADPVIFRIGGYDVALRRAQARQIRVRPGV